MVLHRTTVQPCWKGSSLVPMHAYRYDLKVQNSEGFNYNYIKFSEMMCAGMKIICGNFLCTNTSTKKDVQTLETNSFYLKPVHLRSHSHKTFSFEAYSFETIIHWRPSFIGDHHSLETTFIGDHIHWRPHSLETTFIETTFIRDHIH